MTPRATTVLLILALASIVIVGIAQGIRVGLWMLVGLLGTAGYLAGTWIGIRVAGSGGRSPTRGAVSLLAVFVLKVPPIVLLALAARGAAPEVRDGLLYGAAVVYSVLVSWGILTTRPAADSGP